MFLKFIKIEIMENILSMSGLKFVGCFPLFYVYVNHLFLCTEWMCTRAKFLMTENHQKCSRSL